MSFFLFQILLVRRLFFTYSTDSTLLISGSIGYVRAAIGLLLCLIMPTCPYTTAVLYLFAQIILDHADGIAARKLKQGRIISF